MKLSARARYALRLMREVARIGAHGVPAQIGEVGEITGLSKRFLSQLAVALKNDRLLRSTCGRNGGYVLARPPEQITVGQILTAADGPIVFAECVALPQDCARSEHCECRNLWVLLDERVREVLDGITLADLLKRAPLAQNAPCPTAIPLRPPLFREPAEP